jgi:hypothetical protein
MIKSLRAVLAGAVLAVVSLAGCGGGNPVNTGPFGGSNYEGIVMCIAPQPDGAVFTAGSILLFSNSGPEAIIDKVSFTRLTGFRLLDAWTVPITGRMGYEDATGYPLPARELPPGVLWSKRQRADGAHVPRTPRHTSIALVLVLQLTGSLGTASGLNIYYHTSDGHYHMDVDRSVIMPRRNSHQKCP